MTGQEELCHRGWHVVDFGGGLSFVRFGARMSNADRTLIYRVGGRPDDRACVTIWCPGRDSGAWRCVACGRPIGRPTSRYPLSELAKRRRAEARAGGASSEDRDRRPVLHHPIRLAWRPSRNALRRPPGPRWVTPWLPAQEGGRPARRQP
jgi:hypothetical protein